MTEDGGIQVLLTQIILLYELWVCLVWFYCYTEELLHHSLQQKDVWNPKVITAVQRAFFYSGIDKEMHLKNVHFQAT